LALVDKPQILHTIMALLTNSERAMWVHHGGGRLMVRSVRRGDELRITVTDDGPGIPSGGLTDVIPSNGVTDKPEGGRLMGLAQCRSMIVELGGDLRVENRLGNGATFNIFFPLLDAKPRDFAPSYRQSSFAD
jgi:sensor histidine kinase regulating citrate/malate metabolism